MLEEGDKIRGCHHDVGIWYLVWCLVIDIIGLWSFQSVFNRSLIVQKTLFVWCMRNIVVVMLHTSENVYRVQRSQHTTHNITTQRDPRPETSQRKNAQPQSIIEATPWAATSLSKTQDSSDKYLVGDGRTKIIHATSLDNGYSQASSIRDLAILP